MKSIPLIQASQLLPFTDLLCNLGAPSEKFLLQSRLSPNLLETHTQLIAEYQVWEFAQVAARAEGNQLKFALLVGEDSHLESYSSLGQYLVPALSLKDLLTRYCQYVRSYSSNASFWLTPYPSGLMFCRAGIPEIPIGQAVMECYTLMLMVNLIRSFVGDQWYPGKILLQMKPSPELKEHPYFEQCEIDFNQKHTVVVVDRTALAAESQMDQTRLPGETTNLSKPDDIPNEFVTALRTVIGSNSDLVYPNISVTAAMIGSSPRTLQRRMAEAGTSYAQIVDQMRLKQAIDLIQDPRIKLKEIAQQLGYTNQSHFTRAFKRWTALSPREFRHLGSAAGHNQEC